ncbi:MAG: hypothetical protein ACRDHD_03475, partial [Candidatus Limnocylindria bacterium]
MLGQALELGRHQLLEILARGDGMIAPHAALDLVAVLLAHRRGEAGQARIARRRRPRGAVEGPGPAD